MRKTKNLSLLAVASLVAVATAQEGILLRRELKDGAEDQYSVTFTSKQSVASSAMGDQDFEVAGSMKIMQKMSEVSEKKDLATVVLNVSDLDLKLSGAAAMAESMMGQFPKSYSVKGKLDSLNSYKDLKVEGLNAQQQLMVGSLQSITSMIGFRFPETAIKAGDTWDVNVPKNPKLGTEAAVLKAKLVGDKKVGDHDVWEVTLQGKIPVNLDVGKMMESSDSTGMPPMNMVMKGTNTMNTVYFIQKSTGKLVSMETTLNSDQSMDMVDMNMTVDVKGTTTATMKLIK